MEKLTDIIDCHKQYDNSIVYKFVFNNMSFNLVLDMRYDDVFISVSVDFEKLSEKLQDTHILVNFGMSFVDENTQTILRKSINSVVCQKYGYTPSIGLDKIALTKYNTLRGRVYIYSWYYDCKMPFVIYDKNELYSKMNNNYDVVIYTIDEHKDIYEFRAHTQILSIQSEYFHKIFSTLWNNHKLYTCIHPRIMWTILKFIYCLDVDVCNPLMEVPLEMLHKVIDKSLIDEILSKCGDIQEHSEIFTMDLQYWFELLYVSDQYMIEKIKTYCEHILYNRFINNPITNRFYLMELSKLEIVSPFLSDSIKNVVISNIKDFLQSDILKIIPPESKKFILDLIM